MNASLPFYRRWIHPAWFLLFLPSLLASALNFSPEFSRVELASAVVEWVLALLVVMPLVWVRWRGVGGAAHRFSKECRVQLPGWLLAFLGPGIGMLAPEGGAMGVVLYSYALGCVLMAAFAFGREFEQRTLGGLLTQPISRSRMFLEKLAAPGYLIGLASAYLLLLLNWRTQSAFHGADISNAVVLLVMAVCSAPYFSILSRGTLPGVVFALAMPPLLWVLEAALVRRLEARASVDWLLQGRLHFAVSAVGVTVYCVGSILLAWRSWCGLQLDKEGAGGKGSVTLHPLSDPMDALLSSILAPSDWKSQLIRKEARLHVIPWLIAAIMVGLWALLVVLRRVFPESPEWSWLFHGSGIVAFTGMLAALAILGAGAAVVAEERELGTLDWQITQPITLWRQWWIKVFVAATAAILVGVLLPSALLPACLGVERIGELFRDVRMVEWIGHAGLGVLLFVMAVYASSLCRSTVTAALAAVGLMGLVLTGIVAGVALPTPSLLIAYFDLQPCLEHQAWLLAAFGESPILLELLLILGLGALGWLGGVLWLAGRNFRAAPKSTRFVARQIARVILAGMLGVYLLMAILLPMINRTWGKFGM